MKYIISILLIYITISTSGLCQGNELIMDLGVSGDFYNDFSKKKDNVIGNPFIFDDLNKGTLILKNGSTFKNIVFNINLEENMLYVMSENSSEQIIIDNKRIESVRLNDETERIFSLMEVEGKVKFIENLYSDGLQKLIVDHNKKFLRANNTSTSGYEQVQKDSYTYSKKTYYITGKEINEIKNKKTVNSIIIGNSKDLQSFVKKHNLNLNDNTDIIKILKYKKDLL